MVLFIPHKVSRGQEVRCGGKCISAPSPVRDMLRRVGSTKSILTELFMTAPDVRWG